MLYRIEVENNKKGTQGAFIESLTVAVKFPLYRPFQPMNL